LISKDSVETFLNVETNWPTSDSIKNPSFIDSSEHIQLIFSENLDMSTVLDSIKINTVKSNLNENEVDVVLETPEGSKNILNISRPNSEFRAGENYKLTVNTNLKSSNGKSLEKEFNSYFSINNKISQDVNVIETLNDDRSWIVCISDLHLGADDAYSELTKNRDSLVDFLSWVRLSPNVKELVIAGDLIDEWFVPMNLDTFKGKTQMDFVKNVALNNKPVIDAFNEIINDGLIKLTYVPGNHDILITAEEIEAILPGINQARDVRGLGAYTPNNFPELVIEHGHRYNFFCAPDHSNRVVTKTDSILPTGYFFTRMATSSIVQGRPEIKMNIPPVIENELGEEQYLYFLYYKIWEKLINDFPVNEGIEKPAIHTGIDGFTDFYAIKDILPFQNPEDKHIEVNLYNGIVENWEERQANNLVPIIIPPKEAILKAASSSHLDDQSANQFFINPNSNKRIVIFGHTHDARLITSYNENSEENVYVNSGTWIDSKDLSMTFVVVIPPKYDEINHGYVGLYQYSKEGKISKMDSQTLKNLKH
jgi:UDP-2,3-diacylglucosamine pyrophosphatase LpxH